MTLRSLLGALLLTGAIATIGAGPASAACSDSPEVTVKTVDKTFPSGSRWFFTILRRPCHGLAIGTAYYMPRGAPDFIKVLDRAYIAEIQVSYASGATGSFEVTSTNEGLGDTNMAGNSFAVPLTTTECEFTTPGSGLFDGNRVCVNEDAGEGYRWRHLDETPRMAHAVEVFMSSQVALENYITKWEFHDDGSIEASLGISGTVPLVKMSNDNRYPNYGGRLNPQSAGTAHIGISHVHSVHWFLDFDIGGASDDKVLQSVFKPDPAADCPQPGIPKGTCGEMTFTNINTESARVWSSTEQTTWWVMDKVQTNLDTRNIAYEIGPHQSGIWRGLSSEPWTTSDLWVTAYNGCERFAAKNVTPHLPASCAGAKAHVQAMVDGQSVDGADVVLWYAQRMLHNHRDEDQNNMPIEWMHFEIKPRNLFHKNPIEP